MTDKTPTLEAPAAPGPWRLTTVAFGMTGCDNCGTVIRANFKDLPGDQHYVRKTGRPLFAVRGEDGALDKHRTIWEHERHCLNCGPFAKKGRGA